MTRPLLIAYNVYIMEKEKENTEREKTLYEEIVYHIIGNVIDTKTRANKNKIGQTVAAAIYGALTDIKCIVRNAALTDAQKIEEIKKVYEDIGSNML